MRILLWLLLITIFSYCAHGVPIEKELGSIMENEPGM